MSFCLFQAEDGIRDLIVTGVQTCALPIFVFAVWLWRGPWAAALVAPALPLTGYVALQFAERLDRVIGATRALSIFLLRRRAFLRLTAERRAIREEILALGREVDAVGSSLPAAQA